MAFWNKRITIFTGWSQSAFSDRFFWLFFVLWLLPLLVSLGYTLLNFAQLPLQIPLFYSRVWGEAQLAKAIYIYLPALGVFLLGLFDLSLAVNLHAKDRVFAYLAAGTSSLLAVLCFITTFNIINLMR